MLAGLTRRGAAATAPVENTEIPAQNAVDALTCIRDLLPAELAPHLRQVRVRDGMLIVYAESAAWGARLRLALTEHIASCSAPLLPGLPVNPRVLARVTPVGGYRR
ncbi:MAG: DUF721 domain-containing protein [Nevskiaceae bacterium]|nr:DUF721 domain-containing protein [Nevskiaceae bacterium]